MRSTKSLLIGAAAAAAMAAFPASAKDLKIGDPAPAINIEHWVKGEKINSLEEGKVYVVEFWATWCGPCKASMPHISQLQNEYKDYDVRFIGVSDEDLETVTGFLAEKRPDGKTWDEIIEYTLTTDPDESVKNDYFKAAGQRGIPSAFIVGKTNQIEWIGHPMSIDKPLNLVVHDKWDREAYKLEVAARKEITDLLQKGEHEAAIKKIDTFLETHDAPELLNTKFNVLLVQLNRPKDAYAVAETLVKHFWDDAQMLNAIAWNVVDNPNVTERNIPFATRVATRASELTDFKDGMILDTLARAYYEGGDLDKAIEWQRKAVEHTEPGPMQDQIKEVLEKYESEK